MLAETDKDDPCDPNPECATCLSSKPAATPTPTAAPTAKPTTPPAPTPKPTAEPTPTATPEPPGFEAVFANFFASQKPLLKMLRNCRTVSRGVSSGEKEEVRTKQNAKF
ncbi:MAG: hypothetical protein WA977_07010 [Halobacteriota archaeon]